MGIAAPVIEVRTYETLLDELLRRIPVDSPEWSDFNDSDPGVTLVEVFTFLTDSLLWQIDDRRLRRRRRIAFLVGTAGIGLSLWMWDRLRPDSEACGGRAARMSHDRSSA